MARQKKHHYVPRFYLKLFSESGLSVNLFNILSERAVIGANLKNQCYRNYFYGKDSRTEDALSLIEGVMSGIIRSVISDCVLPPKTSEDRVTFLLYILIQNARTVYSSDALDEQLDKLMKHLIEPQIKEMNLDAEQLHRIKITHENSARFGLAVATPLYPLLIDLEWKLLRASDRNEFITSDNPVVFYNQLLFIKRYASNTGLSLKGLQVFFPIGPKHMLILYDSEVYRVGSRRSTIIDVSNSRDIEQLNRLQFVSALENIYFRDAAYPVNQEFQCAKQFRRQQKARMRVFTEEETDEKRKERIAISKEDVRTDLEVSFIRLLKSAKEWRRQFQHMNPRPAVVVRNKCLVRELEDFLKLVDAGRYKPGEFFSYIRDIQAIRA